MHKDVYSWVIDFFEPYFASDVASTYKNLCGEQVKRKEAGDSIEYAKDLPEYATRFLCFDKFMYDHMRPISEFYPTY